MPELSRSLADVVRQWSDKPFVFFGHSLGALVAFEVARELRRETDREPEHFFVSASRAPQLPWPHPIIHHLPEMDFLAEVDRRYGSVPRQVLDDEELRGIVLPALRSDFAVVETYQYQAGPPFSAPVSAFVGDRDNMVSADAMNCWAEQTRGDFRLIQVSGDHLFLQSASAQLIARITEDLDRRVTFADPGGSFPNRRFTSSAG